MTDDQQRYSDEELDDAVQQFSVMAQQRRQAYLAASAVKTTWQTSCVLPLPTLPHPGRLNLQTTRDLDALIKALAYLLQAELGENVAAETLGLPPVLNYFEYPWHAWRADIKSRVDQLKLEEQRLELEALEAEVEEARSERQRRAQRVARLSEKYRTDQPTE